jgi:2-polyprenyl-3-methyl-5-hydroxy-6-metoxy-1,4-benzoquinol methylase
MTSDDIERYRDETREVWNRNAEYWDARMATPNDWHATLVRPPVEHLLALRPGETILEIGAGNGLFSRRLAELEAEVVAIDVSDRLVALAGARNAHARIDYRVVDATDEEALLALGEGRFDAAVSTMVLMDMPTLEPLARALVRLLKPNGRFVFASAHPCFNTTGISLAAEMEDQEGNLVIHRSIKVRRYLDLRPAKGAALAGQPVPQYYFDRPFHALLGPFFAAGLAMNALVEPAFSPQPGAGTFSWASYPQFPPVVVGRLQRYG